MAVRNNKWTPYILTAMIVAGALSTTSCTNMTQKEQRVVSGAAIGAGVGTVGTAMTGGCVSCGAAIGTAVGAGAGYVVDEMNK